MGCHNPPLEKAKKQGEMPLPIFSPIPSLSSRHTSLNFAQKILLNLENFWARLTSPNFTDKGPFDC